MNRLARLSDSQRWWVAGAVGTLLLVAVSVAAFWPSPGRRPGARQYIAFTACLLTDAQGVAGPGAAPVWAGMQDASAQTHAKVEYLSVSGPATRENAEPFLASLVNRHCDVVLAVGPAQVAALRAVAPASPTVGFVVIGDDMAGPNVVRIDASSPDKVRTAVRDAVVSAVHR